MSTELMSEFLSRLHASRLLDNDRIDELLRRPEPPQGDVEGVERFLEGKGWLTRFQIDEIRQGRGDRLTFHGYKLTEKLADLPNGTVYKAIHPALVDSVAFQWINPDWLEPSVPNSEFLSPILRVSAISHPHLLNVLNAGQAEGAYFIVSEWVDSTDLGRLVSEMGAVPVPLACEYTRQAALGLQAVHERGLVHGDLSPARMLLFPVVRKVKSNGTPRSVRPNPSATLKLAGAAQNPLRPPLAEIPGDQLSRAGEIACAAPERVYGSGQNVAQDIYSLGASLYFLLAGRTVVRSTQPAEMLSEVLHGEPIRIETLRNDMPAGLANLVHKMLSKDPAQRPASSSEVVQALQPFSTFSAPTPKVSAIPLASETISGPVQILNEAIPLPPEPEPLPIAEVLPGVEPLPATVTDSKVYSPRNLVPEIEHLPEHDHHDPFGGRHDHHEYHDPFAGDDHHDDQPGQPRRQAERAHMSNSKLTMLIVIAVALHLFAYTLAAWQFKIWPFGESEEPSEPTKSEQPHKLPKKKSRSTSALEWPIILQDSPESPSIDRPGSVGSVPARLRQ
jgi:serine/threonine protein kinase